MHRRPVESSVIASMGYDPQWRVLELEFRDTGHIYTYFDVSADEYSDLLQAESKGTYLNEVFKLRGFRYERVA